MGKAYLYLMAALYVVPLGLTLPIHDDAAVVLYAGFVAALLGLFVVRARFQRFAAPSNEGNVDGRVGVILFVIGASFVLLLQAPRVVEVVQTLRDGTFLERGLEKALDRYDGASAVGAAANLSTVLYFAISGILGFITGRVRRRTAICVYVLYVVCALVDISDLSRTSTAIGASFLVTAYLVANSDRVNRDWRVVVKGGVLAAVAGFVLFVAVQGGRVYTAEDPGAIVAEKAGSYVLAPYAAFWTWFQGWSGQLTFGYDTFAFAYKLAGISPEAGFFDPVDTVYGGTNLYLNLRGIVEDVGAALSVVAVFVAGVLILRSELASLERRIALGFPLLLFALYPFYSVFLFTTAALGAAVFIAAAKWLLVSEASRA